MSHCHGWSAGPAYLLPTHVLGVQPVEPGFARVRIAPQLGDLAWAEGIVPTPHGDVSVRRDNEPLRGAVTLPPGMEGKVVLPARIERSLLISIRGRITSLKSTSPCPMCLNEQILSALLRSLHSVLELCCGPAL